MEHPAKPISIAAQPPQHGLSHHAIERIVLGLLALAASVEVFRFALRVTEDLLIALMAPVFCFLLAASLVAAGGTKGR